MFPAIAAGGQWQYDGVERIVALSDIHGAYKPMVRTLQSAAVIGEDLAWTAGNTHLVIVGDILDRGPESRQAMDLLMKLEPEAAAAGGKVHVLIGNHEAMNLIADLRYVSKSEYAAFAEEESAADRDRSRPRRPGRYPSKHTPVTRAAGPGSASPVTAHAQLEHGDLGVVGAGEQRQRQAEVVFEVAGRAVDAVGGGQPGRHELLGHRLAGAPGHRHHLDARLLLDLACVGGATAERLRPVSHADHRRRHRTFGGRVLLDDRGGPSRLRGIREVPVQVVPV